MLITNKKNQKRKRSFEQKKLINNDDNFKSLIKFYKPATVKGTAILTHSKKDNKTQWVYLPALSSIRQLNSSEKSNSFMGSDFNYEDIAGRHPLDDEHILSSENDKYFLITSTPKDSTSTYSKLESLIDKKRLITLRIKFYNKNNKLFKTLTNKQIKNFSGMYLATKTLMNNHSTGGHTFVETLNVSFKENSLTSIFL